MVKWDTCCTIAKTHNITLLALEATNPDAGCGPNLRIGTVLIIPQQSPGNTTLLPIKPKESANKASSEFQYQNWMV